MSVRSKAVLGMIATALLWSTGGVLIKWVHGNPLGIAGARSAIAALLMWAFLRRPKFDGSLAQMGGAVAYAVTILLYIPAVKLTTAANAILLQYTAPVYVAIFGAWFLKERASWRDWLSVAVTLGGMALFLRQGLASQSLLGDGLAALSGVTIAWMVVFLRKQKDGNTQESLLLGNILTAIVGLPFLSVSTLTVQDGLLLGVLGVFQLGLAYILYGMAIRHVTALEAILLNTLEPILNPIWVVLLVGEVPGPWALAGGGLVVAAVTVRGVLAAKGVRSEARRIAGQAAQNKVFTS